MPAELFIYRGETGQARTPGQLRDVLSVAGLSCQLEPDRFGVWLVFDGGLTNINLTVEADGTASSAIVQTEDITGRIDRLLGVFNELGWQEADAV
jgi:hypothetical protein